MRILQLCMWKPPKRIGLHKRQKSQLQANLELARHLKADIVSTYGDDIAYQISQYAKNAHVSKLVLGRSYQKPSIFRKTTLVDQLSKLAPEIEIYIIPDQQSGAMKKKVPYALKIQIQYAGSDYYYHRFIGNDIVCHIS